MSVFYTERTTLAPITSTDIEDFLPLLKEPSSTEFIVHLKNKTDQEYRAFLSKKIEAIKEGKTFYWLVRAQGELIGNINLTPYEDTSDWHIGFRISEKYRQQGFATEVSNFAISFAQKILAKSVLYGLVVPENKASKYTLQKLGFEFDKLTHSQVYDIDLEVWKISLA